MSFRIIKESIGHLFATSTLLEVKHEMTRHKSYRMEHMEHCPEQGNVSRREAELGESDRQEERAATILAELPSVGKVVTSANDPTCFGWCSDG
jgi:hypothetical protein